MKPLSLLTFLFLSLAALAQSNTGSYKIDHFGKSDGINQSSVNFIFQDSEDLLWIGTFGGLNTFDGYEFQSFAHEFGDSTTLSDNAVWTVYEDSNNRIWVGSKGGLSLFDPAHQIFKNFSPKRSEAKVITNHSGIT